MSRCRHTSWAFPSAPTDTDDNVSNEIVSLPDGELIENAFLTPDGTKVLFTTGEGIYAMEYASRELKLLFDDARLIAITPDSKTILFESFTSGGELKYHMIAGIDGSGQMRLYGIESNPVYTQFIGWFSK